MPYSYAEANGFIPVIHLTQSDQSIYSDYPGEDIWEKFFDQPFGPEANEWKNAVNVWQFPKACTTFSDRWLMRKIVDCKEVNFITLDYINNNVKKEVDAIRNKVLPNPNETIGALIRGTDYTTTQLPGHTIMASPEQVMTKLNELMSTGKYSHIYLATEDIDVLEKMQELCGEKITYIDQKRFRINPGELLADQKKDRENEGWLKGKEYLTSLKLLSECGAFVASGGCSGTDCALNSGKENYKETYVFRLGCN